MITHEYARAHEIVGRTSELETLRRVLSEDSCRALAITGSAGVGKTALATRIVEIAKAGALADRFDQHLWVPAYRQTWPNVITKIGQTLLGHDTVLKSTLAEIEERIIDSASRRRILVVLDDLEQDAAATELIQRWQSASHLSTLIITAVAFNYKRDGIAALALSGIQSDTAILDLLGDRLQNRFGANQLLVYVKPLEGIPLNLLYLRWLDPIDIGTLLQHVEGLGRGTLDRSEAVEDLLSTVTRTPAPFMALGIVRRLQFDESLLAFFWDRMGGGSSEAYLGMRDRLVSTRLLIPVQGLPGAYRITEDIHKQLYRALSARIGEERIVTAHFFAAEYYRRQFEQTGQVEDLQFYLHHCRECGEHQWAYAFIFETNVLRRLQKAGMVLQLRALLEGFLEAAGRYHAFQRVNICMAMAAACNDLSDFDGCLAFAQQADELLAGVEKATSPDIANVRRQLAYYSAVAHSNTGRSEQCLRSYYQVIAGSPADGDPLGCLAVSYLAHELKYHNLELSLGYGREALEWARKRNDLALVSRALCSLAETEIFLQKHDDAHARFKEARSYCTDSTGNTTDVRELGRIVKNWGLLCFVRGQLDEALSKLAEARLLSLQVGDRRRVASGDLYASLVVYRCGNTSEGSASLTRAIIALSSLKDGRYLVPALMTLAYWTIPAFDGRRKSLSALNPAIQSDLLREPISEVINHDRFEIYAGFWREHFGPRIVFSRGI